MLVVVMVYGWSVGDEEDAGMSRGCWRGWRVLTWPTVYMGEVAGEGGGRL